MCKLSMLNKVGITIFFSIIMFLTLSSEVYAWGEGLDDMLVRHIIEGGSPLSVSDAVCSTTQIDIRSDGMKNKTFADIAKSKGNNGIYNGVSIKPVRAEFYLTDPLGALFGGGDEIVSVGINENVYEAYDKLYTGWDASNDMIYIYYEVVEPTKPPVEPGTLNVCIDYVASEKAHTSSSSPYCTSYSSSSKVLRTSSRTVKEGTQKIYVDVGNAPKVAIGSYVGSDKALHIMYNSSDSTQALTKSGYSFTVTLDASGNVTVVEPTEYTTYRKANENASSAKKATYTLSQLNGELHIVVECKGSVNEEDDDYTEPYEPPYEVTPDEPYTPPVYEEPDVQNGVDSETRTGFKLEHLNPLARAMIRSDEVGNEKYNNLHVGDKYFGIPTSETQWCYLEITFNMYRLGYNKIEGVKYYDVTVTTEYSYPYTEEVNGEEVSKTGTYTVERVYQYERNYVYYIVTAYDAYQLIRADVVNATLTGAGRVTMYEGDLQLANGVKCPGDHTDAYNGEHMRLTLNGNSVPNHMTAKEGEMQIKLTRTATSKEDAKEQAAQELGVSVSSLGSSSSIKNKTQTNSEIKAYSNNNESNKIWKEASDKTVLTVENDEIFHGRYIDQNTGEEHTVYLMELSTARTNNAEDVAETKSPAETANEQNILEILRWLIDVPTSVSNEEYDSHIEGYYKRADDSLISGIRGAGVPGFPASEPLPFLQKI